MALISALHTVLLFFLYRCLTQRTIPPSHTDWLVFHCCTGRSVSGARTFGQCCSICARANAADDLLHAAQKCTPHVTFLTPSRKKKILKSHRRRIKSTAHGKQEPTIHRNSKWSCNSTCFDSSGRICAVCEQKLRQTTAALSPFIPVTIHKSTNTCLMWISLTNTDCCCFSWFFLNFFFFFCIPIAKTLSSWQLLLL